MKKCWDFENTLAYFVLFGCYCFRAEYCVFVNALAYFDKTQIAGTY